MEMCARCRKINKPLRKTFMIDGWKEHRQIMPQIWWDNKRYWAFLKVQIWKYQALYAHFSHREIQTRSRITIEQRMGSPFQKRESVSFFWQVAKYILTIHNKCSFNFCKFSTRQIFSRYFVPLGNWEIGVFFSCRETAIKSVWNGKELGGGNGNRKSNWDYFQMTWYFEKQTPYQKKRETKQIRMLIAWCVCLFDFMSSKWTKRYGGYNGTPEIFSLLFWLHSMNTKYIHSTILTNYGC